MSSLTFRDVAVGGLTYAVGDTIAVMLAGEFQLSRALGMLCLGGTVYAAEIPAYFRWLERRYGGGGRTRAVLKACLSAAFFNPLWITRHYLFIALFSGELTTVSWLIFKTAGYSFLTGLVIALPANYLIQNAVPLNWRFFASSIFSGLMALYFSISRGLFD